MIANLKPYPAYVESEQAWLGSIPAHWGQFRAKRLFREVDEQFVENESFRQHVGDRVYRLTSPPSGEKRV